MLWLIANVAERKLIFQIINQYIPDALLSIGRNIPRGSMRHVATNSNPVAYDQPIPYRGQLGLFEIDEVL